MQRTEVICAKELEVRNIMLSWGGNGNRRKKK